MRLQAPRGTNDVLPSESFRWAQLEHSFRQLTALYGYQEIRTPSFEDTALFARTAGETSDIVTKQMYTFEDKGGRSITLKPEGTAPAIRAALEHQLIQQGNVVRLSYVTPIFRYERPQLGRYREAHQVGLELIGSASPLADAEVIEVTVQFYRALGLPDTEVNLNSLGREQCRTRYRAAILSFASVYLAELDLETRAKIEKNPLRLLDMKDPKAIEAMASAPKVTDYLEPECKLNFEEVQIALSGAGIRYRLAPEVVRGLDYYTETVFELLSTKLGAQGALCGGGRYDHLVQELGGPSMPGVGVGMGIERALIVLGSETSAPAPIAFLVGASARAGAFLANLARELRAEGVSVLRDLEGRNLKQQMKLADRSGARMAVLIGEDEMANGTATLRRLADGHEEKLPVEMAKLRLISEAAN